MTVSVSQQKNFVGGEWVDAVNGETMAVINPATEEVLAEFGFAADEIAELRARKVV